MRKSALFVVVMLVVMIAVAPVFAGEPPTRGSFFIPGGFDPAVGKYFNIAHVEMPVGYDLAVPFQPAEDRATFMAIVEPEDSLWEALSVPAGTKRFTRTIKVWSGPEETIGMIDICWDFANADGYKWSIEVFRPDGRQIATATIHSDDMFVRGSVTVPVIKAPDAAYTIVVTAAHRSK